MNHVPGNIKSRKIAILVANGVDGAAIDAFKAKLAEQGALAKIIGPSPAPVKTADGKMLPVDAAMDGMPSVMFDAVFVRAAPMPLRQWPNPARPSTTCWRPTST